MEESNTWAAVLWMHTIQRVSLGQTGGETCDACLSDCVESLETWPGSISVLIRQLFPQSQGQIFCFARPAVLKPKMATITFYTKTIDEDGDERQTKTNIFRQKLNLCLFQHPTKQFQQIIYKVDQVPFLQNKEAPQKMTGSHLQTHTGKSASK